MASFNLEDYNCLFSVGTHQGAINENGTGLCWGIISYVDEQRRDVVVVAKPDIRGRIKAVQHVPLDLLQQPLHVLEPKDSLIQNSYFLKDPANRWSSKVFLTQEQRDPQWLMDNIQLISYYLKRVCSGHDHDERVYRIPSDHQAIREFVIAHDYPNL